MATSIGTLAYTLQLDAERFNKGLKASKREIRDGRRAIEANQTPLAKYNQSIKRLDLQLKQGVIDQRTFNAELRKSKRRFNDAQKAGSAYSKVLTGMKGLGIGVGIAGVAGAFRGARALTETMAAIDETAKSARKLGIEYNELTAIQFAAAEASGMQGAAVTKGLQRMITVVGDATDGLASAELVFSKLGLSAEKLNKMSIEDQFAAVADAINDIDNENEKLAISTDLFGNRAADLINTLALGSDGLGNYRDTVKELGLEVSDAEAKQVEAANDAIARSAKMWEGLKTTLAVDLAPAMMELAQAATEMTKAAMPWIRTALGLHGTAQEEATEVISAANRYRGTISESPREMGAALDEALKRFVQDPETQSLLAPQWMSDEQRDQHRELVGAIYDIGPARSTPTLGGL